MVMVGVLTRVTAEGDEGDGGRLFVDLDDFLHHPVARGDGADRLPVLQVDSIEMEPAASFRKPKCVVFVKVVTVSGAERVNELWVFL